MEEIHAINEENYPAFIHSALHCGVLSMTAGGTGSLTSIEGKLRDNGDAAGVLTRKPEENLACRSGSLGKDLAKTGTLLFFFQRAWKQTGTFGTVWVLPASHHYSTSGDFLR